MHSSWWIFHARQCNMTSISCEHCSQLQQSQSHAVMEDWMIYFAPYTIAKTHNYAFQWAGQPSKTRPLPVRDLDPHLIHGSLDPQKSSPQMISRLVQPFLHSTSVWPTRRQTQTTLRVTSVTIGRIFYTMCMVCGLKALHNQNDTYSWCLW